jgi:hypothetical protein
VAAGATSTTFLVSTSPVTLGREVIISAAFADAERNAGLTVTIPIRVGSVSLLPNVVGGRTVTGSVYLNAFPMENVVVTLASSDSAVAAVPDNVMFTAWSEQTQFTVSISAVTVPTAVTISATYAGETSSFVVVVNPATFSLR